MRSPCTRMRGGSPAMTCKSEPLRMYMLRRKSSINEGIVGSSSTRGRARALARGRGSAGARRRDAARQHRGIGDEPLELFAVGRVAVGVVRVDELGGNRVQQGLVHELHAGVLAGLELRGNLVRLLSLN